MNNNEVIALDNEYIMGTYGRFPVVPSYGKNATLIDCDGNTFIDLTSGIGVNSLGIADEGWIKAVETQLHKIQHISNYYYSPISSLVAEKLVKLSNMSKVFFSNSGAEANEGAIKLARKYSFDKYGENRYTILTLKKSFHGRTITTLAATGQDSFHDFFFPFTEGFKYVELNDIDLLKSAITNDVCAIMVESIQGEGGVNILTDSYAQTLKNICDEKDIMLIFDEVQTGIGRTGKMFAYEYYNYTPDIVTVAKGLGGGLPIGAFICNKKLASTLSISQHGTTFGSNPVVCAGANYVLDVISQSEFLEEVNKKGNYIKNRVAKMNIPFIKEIRGKGLMLGIQIDGSPKIYAKKAVENGLLILTAGNDVLRMLPPLTISYEEIDIAMDILNKILT